jgi:hypothetical protein
MQISAEIRWFWRNTPPPGLEDWFYNADSPFCVAGGGKTRVDEYLRDPRQIELGLKRRGGKQGVEVKGLVAVLWDGLAVGPFAGPIELWTKWTSEPLALPSGALFAVEKRRWLRKFDTSLARPQEIPLDADEQPLDKRPLPVLGCNVEFTQITLAGDSVWWTLGFESFGTIWTIANDLRAVATTLAVRQPPALGEGLLASYPAWLSEHAQA